MAVAIRCARTDCKFNDGGWCTLGYIQINEKGECEEYEPDERKRIIEYNTRIAKLIEQLGKMESLSEEDKKHFATLLLLGMKTEDGEHVIDKIEKALKERDGRG